MFGFMRRSAVWRPSKAIRRALEMDGLPPGIGSASLLRVIELKGRFSDRKVTHIRICDPVRVAERALTVRSFRDFDAHPEMVVRAGHIETNVNRSGFPGHGADGNQAAASAANAARTAAGVWWPWRSMSHAVL